MAQTAAFVPTTTPNKYTCVNCKIGFESSADQRLHFKTEWHLYNLKRKVCKLEPIDHESFQQIQELAPKAPQSKSQDNIKSRGSKQLARRDLGSEEDEQIIEEEDEDEDIVDEDETNWEIVDDEELLDEDYDEDEIEEMLGRVVKSNTCLFCDKQSSNMKTNINHMSLNHGFFIPEEQYLIDLEGLMEYLGFKVGAGLTCLWCSKQFNSLHGVRLHMLYKDHCKIQYDQEKAVSEFKDFYDYSGQLQIAMKPLDELLAVTTKKKRIPSSSSSLVNKSHTSKNSCQLISRGSHSAALITQEYHTKRGIKKFNSERAKKLLRIGMTNNNAVRGRLRRQNPM